jgi:hypothetical protein
MSVGERKLDIFESMFRSAVHDRFEWAPPSLRRIVVVSDLGPDATSQAITHAKRLLSTVDSACDLSWTVLDRSHWVDGKTTPIPELIEHLKTSQYIKTPDMGM